MRIKRLDCPAWVQSGSELAIDTLISRFSPVQPRFFRDGYYLIGSVVLIEFNGQAWQVESESSVRAFKWALEDAEHEGVNILSREQSQAIFNLRKVGLASDYQFHLLQRDFTKRKMALENLRWR
jgi:hypothetical protein